MTTDPKPLTDAMKRLLLELQSAEGCYLEEDRGVGGGYYPATWRALERRGLIAYAAPDYVVTTAAGEQLADELNRAAGRETYWEARKRAFGSIPSGVYLSEKRGRVDVSMRGLTDAEVVIVLTVLREDREERGAE